MSRNGRIILIVLISLASVGRAWLGLMRPGDVKSLAELPDQLEYLEAGRNLLAGRGLVFHDPRFDQRIYASRMPGYPMFIAALGGHVRGIRLAQAALDASTALAAYLLARRWLSERRSLIAAALVAFNPLLVHFSTLILSETLYVAMLTWAIYCIVHRRWMVVGLALCALSIHVRPSGLIMPVVLAAAAVPIHLGGWQWRVGAKYVGIAAVASVLVLLPWAWRNDQMLGEWVFLTTNGGITLYDGVHPQASGASDQSFVQQMPHLSALGEVERDRLFHHLAHEQIRGDLWRIAGLALIKTGRTWSPIPLSAQFGSDWRYVAVGLVFAGPFLLAAAAGLFRSVLSGRVRLLLIAPAIGITLVHAMTVGSMRYRLPAEPMLAVLAASACLVSRGRAPHRHAR